MAIWLNGTLHQTGEIGATNAGCLLGWGVFSTLQIQNEKPRFFKRHLERLQRDAQGANVPFEWNSDAIFAGLSEVLIANEVKNGTARLTVTRRGDGRWNADSGSDFSILAVSSAPLPLDDLRAEISPFRVAANAPLAGLKTTSYLPYLWVWQQAQQRGFDEAILLTGEGWVCEAARSNLFWLYNGELWTPSLKTGCLRGIGRDLVLEWAHETRILAHEGEFLASDLAKASEIWLVSAGSGVRSLQYLQANQNSRWNFGGAGEALAHLRRWWQEKSDDFSCHHY